VIRPGDILTMNWASGGGHITTVVSGYGASAQVVDNAVFLSATGAYLNSANDGYANDIVIQGPHSLDSMLVNGGALPATINIYRLDTPTISIISPTTSAFVGSTLSLAKLFSATDAGGAGSRAITEYTIYDTTSGGASADTVSWTGGSDSGHGIQAAATISAAEMSSLTLNVGNASGTDTFHIAAYNGAYWGDTVSFTIDVAGINAAQAVANGASITSAVSITDSGANVASTLDGLESLASANKITNITLTDGGTPTLSISAAQLVTDAGAIGDISGNFSLLETAPTTNATVAGAANALGNTLAFSGDASQYTITPAGDGVHLEVSGGGATLQLSNIQALQFADHTLIVAATPGQGTVTTGNITELYGAVFGRLPDVSGLTFYLDYLKANPTTPLVQFAQYFLESPEYLNNPAHNYAQNSTGDAQFITDSYNNLLHRAPETGAIPFYQSVVNTYTAGLAPGSAAHAAAELTGYAWVLTYFSASPEFLNDVQVTATHPADGTHWLVLT